MQADTRGLNFFLADQSLRDLLALYLPAEQYRHLLPWFERLGELVGGELDELAFVANNNPPQLQHRDRQGNNLQSLEKHPAYQAMERLGFGEFRLAAMSHKPVFGWHQPLHPVAKYAFQYLFAQSEFGLLCPISMTDALTRTIKQFADQKLLDRYLPMLLSDDFDRLAQGAMFMTESTAGSDVAATTTVARQNENDNGSWSLYGDKWFCSNADADLALVLARPENAEAGLSSISLFLMPKVLPDGKRNSYRIIRLKDKLGTRSMASGEITLEGATAWLVGEQGRGFAQIAEMINQSRLSNGVRSAGMMRRATIEAFQVARERQQFGKKLIDMPLMQRQLLKILLPTEQALSMLCFTAQALHLTDTGDEQGLKLRRILTPLIKFRACRDARKITGDAMEVRGGCGYIEEWIEPRLLRDSHLGSIWEGTSNIVALDVLRAARKEHSHKALYDVLYVKVISLSDQSLGQDLQQVLERTVSFVDQVVVLGSEGDCFARQAASALYNVTSAILMAWESTELINDTRLQLAKLALKHRLAVNDSLQLAESDSNIEFDIIVNGCCNGL